jgi:pimeloyl-ACP methyl ester carboxylesterase
VSLHSDVESGNYDRVITEVREWVAEDSSAAFSDATVKRWLSMRWKDIFLTEAIQDPRALETASKPAGLARAIPRFGSDKRTDRQKIADRFLKGIAAPDWQLELPPADVEINRTTLLLVPGLLTGLLHPSAHAFLDEAPALEQERGWPTLRVDAHPFRGCEANNADILESLVHGRGYTADQKEITDPTPPEKVWIIGYSKGGPDVLNFMVNHPEYADRIAGVFTWAGAMSGSYTADSVYEQIKDLDTQSITDHLDRFLQLFNPGLVVKTTGLRRVDEYDVKGAFNDLRTSVREQYNRQHAEQITQLGVPFFSLTGSTTPLEAPAFQFMDTVKMGQFDANNDMQLTQKQATMDIPIATHVAMVHGHHWDIAYSPFPAYLRAASPNLDHPFPRKAALAASWQLLAELGLID